MAKNKNKNKGGGGRQPVQTNAGPDPMGRSGGGGRDKSSFKSAGRVLSQSEVRSIAKAKGITPTDVMSRALDKGIGLGSKVVKNYNTPGGLGNYVYNGTPDNLNPLRGLSIPKGNAYYGASSYSNPSSRSRNSGWSPGSTTYNPIVLPRNGAGGGGGGGGGGKGGKGGGGDGDVKNDGSFESILALYREEIERGRQELEDWKNKSAEEITTLQDGFNAYLDELTGGFDAQLGALQANSDAQVNGLMNQLALDRSNAANTQALLLDRGRAAEAALAEQQRAAAALGRAFVPALEPSAASVQLGDQRTTKRDDKNNTLSSLAITSSLGSNTNALAGLQLA